LHVGGKEMISMILKKQIDGKFITKNC
jgi:hypothetical protein